LCVIGKEGASIDALMASNAVFFNICDALDIFLKPKRMIATLRK
jgi:soluble P-type ATPase